MVSFLPDTSRGNDGSLTVDFGTYFPNAVLILKRTVFDGMKQEEEEITIEVEIRQLKEKTMAAATAPTPRTEEQIQENIDEWKAMGVKAYASDPVKYANATRDSLGGYHISGAGKVIVEDYFLSVDSGVDENWNCIVIDTDVGSVKWHSDLPSLKDATSDNFGIEGKGKIVEWTGKIPNIIVGKGMFYDCYGLTSWSVALPNSLTNATNMFAHCTGLTSWTVELPNSLTDASLMFSSCSGLREFTPSLAGLTNCEDFESMFSGCILNEESIRNILGTLPDRKGKTELTIGIGGDSTMEETVRQQLSSLAQSVSTAKNWNIVLEWNTPQTV